MLIHLNCLSRAEPAELAPILPALADAVHGNGLDPDRLHAVLDWVQYRNNFREPVVARPFAAAPDSAADGEGPSGELAIDVRRAGDGDLAAELQTAVEELARGRDGNNARAWPGRVYLEPDPTPTSTSTIWAFNRAYWAHLSAWEATFKKEYTAALPGGTSDGTNPDFWSDRIERFIEVLVELDQRSTLPDVIYVLELGVGSGEQARIWLDTFQALCLARGLDYYERLHYLMTDFSHDVLETARRTVGPHDDRVTHLDLDFQNPLEALAAFRYKVLFVHSCNLYDNLPTDEVIRVGDRVYEVLVRAYVPAGRAAEICAARGVDLDDLVDTINRVLRFGPGTMGDRNEGVLFWSELWQAVRLEETYVEIADPSTRRLATGANVRLSDVLAALPDAKRVHLSSVAVESFVNTLTLLHPAGVFQVLDIFVREAAQYSSFRGPGKLDGSIVNWLNGPLFRAIGERLGFHVSLEPFPYREGSNTVVLSTTPKD
jgi:hypothetical protein